MAEEGDLRYLWADPERGFALYLPLQDAWREPAIILSPPPEPEPKDER